MTLCPRRKIDSSKERNDTGGQGIWCPLVLILTPRLLYLNWECRIFMPRVFIAWEQFRYETTLLWKKSSVPQNEGIWGLGILAGCTVSSNLSAKFPFANLSKQECRQLEQDEIVISPKGTCWSGRVRHEFESKASVTTLTLLHAVRAGPRRGRFNP